MTIEESKELNRLAEVLNRHGYGSRRDWHTWHGALLGGGNAVLTLADAREVAEGLAGSKTE